MFVLKNTLKFGRGMFMLVFSCLESFKIGRVTKFMFVG